MIIIITLRFNEKEAVSQGLNDLIKKYAPVLVLLAFLSNCSATKNSQITFGVGYKKLLPQELKNYELVIVEPDHYTKREIDKLKLTNAKLLAYVSLSEVDSNRWYFPLVEMYGFAGTNPNWKSYYMDLSKEEVCDVVLNKVIKNIMIKGFDGLFFDTIDGVASYTERANMQDNMIDLIKSIRAEYPKAILIQNAGFDVLPETRSSVNAVLIEDLASDYSFSDQSYHIKNEIDYNKKLTKINAIADSFNVNFLIVDFAKSERTKEQLKQRLHKQRFPYFISTIDLQELPAVR